LATLAEMTQHIRAKLLDPESHAPSRGKILLEIRDEVQRLHNRLGNSRAPWSLESVELQITPTLDDQNVAVPQGGYQIGHIESVFTYDPTDPYHVEEDVPIVAPDQISQFYRGPVRTSYNATNSHSVALMAFYLSQSGYKVRPRPVPSQTERYQLWFRTGRFTPQALEQEPILGQYHPMVEDFACLKLLPACKWAGVSAAARAARVDEIRRARADSIALWKDDFETFIRTNKSARVENLVAFGEEYDFGPGYYLGC
jgi:hypothetical protein